jgi:hypothetical protein
MKTSQLHFINGNWKTHSRSDNFDDSLAQLVFMFGAGAAVSSPEVFNHVKNLFPKAEIVSSSTSGEIMKDAVYDESVSVMAIQFIDTKIRCAKTVVNKGSNSFETGKKLMEELKADDLVTIFVVSEGSFTNGSELVNGFNQNNPKEIPVTGGMAGDADRFQKTQVGLNEPASEGNVVAIGFYGKKLKIGHSSFGGWDEFGRERIITKSDKNVLYEIDGRNALDLYKEYLGPYVNELPGSALFFPLSMRVGDSDKSLVRTILAINEDDKSMTFAGNLPEGNKVRLMKANFDRIINASSIAATHSLIKDTKNTPELAILISCVGRKLILQERTYEEVKAARDIFGTETAITGFYSYGELSPFNQDSNCELHNQTMTITTFTEN